MAIYTEPKTIYGLIGYPLRHSFSIDYFNHKFHAEDINAEYVNFEIEDIGDLMEIIAEEPRLNGLNVTSPYKEQVLPYMNHLDESAEVVGAVNVIKFVRQDKGLELHGYNSDVMGFLRSVQPLINEERKQAMILGTGGAAKAVAHALRQLGVEVSFVSRQKTAHTVVYEEITKNMVHANKLIINATPLGKFPDVDKCPDFPYKFLTKEHLCYDLVYNPDETLFMKKSLQAGAQVKNGLEMLLLQAFESYSIWTR
ncbi:MAG: shikimate dehydrogenase [Muribaculaceae bacterium]|nr:shikimate dehydrogenase [Muribaculaceae bacterium]